MADAKLTIKDLPTAVTVAEDADLLALWDDSDNTTSQFSVADLKTSVINPLIAAEAAIRLEADVTLQDNIDLKANIDSPTLTGIPLAPTATSGTDTDQLATTAFVKTAVDAASGAVVSVNDATGAVVIDATSVGLGGFTGLTPATLPLSTAETAALANKEQSISSGLSSQVWQGDKTWIAKTSLPISTAQQTALDTKEPNIPVGTVAQYWRGDKTFQPVSDLPVSTDQQTAIDAKVENAIVSGHTTIAPSGDIVSKSAILGDQVQSLSVAYKYQARQNIGFTAIDQRVLAWGNSGGATWDGISDNQFYTFQQALSPGASLGASYAQRLSTYSGGATSDSVTPANAASRGYNQIGPNVNYCNEGGGLFVADNYSWLGQGVGHFGQAVSYHGGRTFGSEAEAKQRPEYYTATASQTVFVVPNNFKKTAMVVVKNGAVLTSGVDYNATAIPGATTSGSISSMSGSGTVVTVAFSGGFTPPVNYSVDISGATPNAYNGRWRVLTSSAGNATLSCVATGTVTVLGTLSVDSTLAGSVTLTSGATAGDSIIIARGDPTFAAIAGEAIVYADGGTDNANTISGNRVGYAISGYRYDKTFAAPTNIGTLLSVVCDPTDSSLTVDRGVLFQGKFGTAIDFTASNFTATGYLLRFNTTNAGVSANANNFGVGNLGLFTPAGYATVQAGNTTNGGILRFGDNTHWGRVACSTAAGMTMGTETNIDVIVLRSSSEVARFTSTAFRPGTDNTLSCGTASQRWSVVYAATGTINTSDAREKTQLRPLSDAELRAIKTIVSGIGAFQYMDAVALKGADSARLHIGVTAQQVKSAFEAEGLDASHYAAWCEDAVMHTVEKTVKKTVTQQVMDEQTSYDIVLGEDGVPRRIAVKSQVGRTEAKNVLDEDGNAIMVEGKDGNKTPMIYHVPVMESVKIEVTETTEEPLLGPDGTPYIRMGLRESHLFWLALASLSGN